MTATPGARPTTSSVTRAPYQILALVIGVAGVLLEIVLGSAAIKGIGKLL